MPLTHSPEAHKEIEKYTDAVWDFMMEHCDVTKSGKLFIKFHMNGRKDFEKRVWARYKGWYHRGDPKAREEMHIKKAIESEIRRKAKRKEYVEQRKKRHARRDFARNMEEWTNWYYKTQAGGIWSRIKGYILAHTWKKKPRI